MAKTDVSGIKLWLWMPGVVGLALVAGYLAYGWLSGKSALRQNEFSIAGNGARRDRRRSRWSAGHITSFDRVDEADLESFPASDPPAWTSGRA